MKFLSELKKRNRLLYIFGWICWIGVLATMIASTRDEREIMNVNAWIKPFKFFLSIAIFTWTMAWYLFYLDKKNKVKIYSAVIVVAMSIELFIINMQAIRGVPSHFNISTRFDQSLYNMMGIAIVVLTLWTLYIAILFFRQKNFSISQPYLWGIRLGLIFFVLFSFEGGYMAVKLAHSVGGPDGSPGLPILNWSRSYGDLRVAHFVGIHSLQVLPMVGYYIATRKSQVFVFAALYFLMVASLFVLALYKHPLIQATL